MKFLFEWSGPAFGHKAVAISEMNIAELRAFMADIRTRQAKLDAQMLEANARMISLMHDPVAPTFVIPERELVAHGGLTSREAREVVSRGLVTEAAPEMAAILAAGDTTAAHVDALGRGLKIAGAEREAFLTHLPELVEASTTMTASQFDQLVKETAKSVVTDDGLSTFERQKRETFFKMRTEADGCLSVSGKFDPISASILKSKIGRFVEAMFHSGDKEVPVEVMPWIEPNDHRQAQALIALVNGASESASDVPTRAEIVVHVDLETLQHGLHAGGTCRTALGADLPVETVRRLACEAEILPVVLDGRSVPIDVGRSKRLATVHQRRALEAIHPTCAIPDCEVIFDHCNVHHIEYWAISDSGGGGATDLNNMVPLCSRHHHAAHEGGWKLRLDPETRELTIA
ncbi:MAG: DUF222 domain-containing protein [Actinomycetota bacterium]|nr:DUF222 domain-containing protein [Actinomycetota bacterium]MDA3019583.1 DUF222 domain-containing protein [Actinomycetota bacterium]